MNGDTLDHAEGIIPEPFNPSSIVINVEDSESLSAFLQNAELQWCRCHGVEEPNV